jgi:hypothetical protein
VALLVDLEIPVERMPEDDGMRSIAGVAVPVLALSSLEGSAPIKVELALKRIGSDPL